MVDREISKFFDDQPTVFIHFVSRWLKGKVYLKVLPPPLKKKTKNKKKVEINWQNATDRNGSSIFMQWKTVPLIGSFVPLKNYYSPPPLSPPISITGTPNFRNGQMNFCFHRYETITSNSSTRGRKFFTKSITPLVFRHYR